MRASALDPKPVIDRISTVLIGVPRSLSVAFRSWTAELARQLRDARRRWRSFRGALSPETQVSRYTSTAGRLLPGELPLSEVLEDAEHWVAVYEELTGFLLTTDHAGADAIAHFRSRLEYWLRRKDELTG